MTIQRVLSVLGILAASGATSCKGPDPFLDLSPQPLAFGRVALTARAQRTLTVTNTSNRDATLADVTAGSLGIQAPFSLLPESTCSSGLVLAPEATCTLVIDFAPETEDRFEQVLTLTLQTPAGEEPSGREVSSASIEGEGYLDCGYEPDHPLCPEDIDLSFSVSGELDFGAVDIFEVNSRVVTVTNIDADDVTTLGEISNSALSLNDQFTLLPGTTCTSGLALAPGATCDLVIQFRPYRDSFERDTLVVNYTEPAGTPIERLELNLVGRGRLNCALEPTLAGERVRGVDAAVAQNALDTARGTADGNALTYEDGRRRGYESAYSEAYTNEYNFAYDAAYRSAYDPAYRIAYDSSYSSTYSGRYSELVNDSTLCSRGASDGDWEGRSDGSADGAYEGYQDGYADGYPVGLDDGYTPGADAAYWDCVDSGGTPYSNYSPEYPGRPNEAEQFPSGMDSALQQGCYQQGYEATYDPWSYQRAYNAAAAANGPYQNGLRDGRNAGTADGRRDGQNAGTIAGTNDGNRDGTSLGRSDGIAQALFDAEVDAEPVRQQVYSDCYVRAYESAYSRAYTSSYLSDFDRGFDDGYLDGYDDSYSDGYASVTCEYVDDYYGSRAPERRFTAPLRSGRLTRGRGSRYGLEQSWRHAPAGRDGVMADRFVKSRLPRWLADTLGSQRAAELEARRGQSRGLPIREALREEKRLTPPRR